MNRPLRSRIPQLRRDNAPGRQGSPGLDRGGPARFARGPWRRILAIVILPPLAAGCGSGGATVAGRVTLDGRPLPTGSVQFHPQAGGPIAYGSIGPDGRFALRQGASNARLPPGRYTATVVALSSPAPAADESRGEAIPTPITPPRYGDVSTSGLAYDLAPGANEVEIVLTGEGS